MLRSPVPMASFWGESGVILYNDAYAALIGDRHPALLGSTARDGSSEDMTCDDHVRRVRRGGDPLSVRDQAVTVRRAGYPESRWFDLAYSPVVDRHDATVGVLCVAADTTQHVVTERLATFQLTLADDLRGCATPEAIMALTARRLGEELAASRVFYAEITAQGRMTVERDYAHGVSTIVGTHSLESFGPDLLAAYRDGAPVVVRNVGADDRLSDGARAGLTAREVGAFVDVVLFQEDAWVGLLAVQSATPRIWTAIEERLIQGVGERVKVAVERARAEVALRAMTGTLEQQIVERTVELRRYHDIVEATVAPICAFDTRYRLVACNKAHMEEFRRLNGCDSVVGAVFPDQFVPDQAAILRGLMHRALAGESFTIIERFGRPEIGLSTWEISFTPLHDDDGNVIGGFHQANDISERLAAEAELAVAQEALRQSQKVEAMGSLTGGVAHDFNNLLTPIIGALDLLLRKGLGNERERRMIDGALQSADRAKTLVQRLLAFARRQPLQPVAVDIAGLIQGMADLIGSTVGPTIALHVDTTAELPSARADTNQLEMALLNLAVNARDAMPDGGTLTVKAERCVVAPHEKTEVPVGRYICLSVADTGSGMDAATRQRAIEPFFSTKGVGKGTGLGLSMVHGLAAQLGGGLTIDSAPGHGTKITLWLPLSVVAPTIPDRHEPFDLPAIRSGTVLLVDDEHLVRASTADMLAELGYVIVEACSAAEALGLVDAGLSPDLLITDHLMPGMSGAQLAQALSDHLPDLRTLIVSGYAEADGIDAGTARLSKPFRNDELVSSIALLTARPRAAASPELVP
ncbi:ATP-binding protein [Sphingomonas sp. 8AM]|uniref:ATP-binding protein n=1 Tax=Sphingomonas sp. 8AM TaxID=2653170 RepID=UPI001357B87D|nr:ATP-binding protein [Sphingomonas sp. 8AM]